LIKYKETTTKHYWIKFAIYYGVGSKRNILLL